LIGTAALLLTISAPATAFAGASTATEPEYVMKLSSTSATVRAGGTTTTRISFRARPYLRTTRVALSVSGLPGDTTAKFSPPTPRISGHSVLTLTTASSSPAGAFAITVIAITLSSDPIGTSHAFALAINPGKDTVAPPTTS
jgi:hypothetical protein